MTRLHESYRRVALRLGIWGAAGALLVAGGVWLRAQLAPADRPMSSLVPPGALLYLESPDFGSLLSRWNASAEKKAWIASDNYSVLSRSRLLGRLQQAQGEFQTAAGVSPEMQLVTQLAGKQSALAIYDLSNLKFVYVTRPPENSLDANALWQQRPKYEQRQVAGIDFFQHTDGGRTTAFASKGDYFVVATDLDLMAQALTLLAGQPAPSLANEAWFRDVVTNNENLVSATGGSRADEGVRPTSGPVLRLVFNMEQLVGTPQFRTYWIQRNVTEMKQFRAGICDLYESANAFTEKRVLLRKAPAAQTTDDQAVSHLLAYAPDSRSFYQAWADPGEKRVRDMLVQTLTGETIAAPNEALYAPTVTTEANSIGTASDLETRIDEPPAKPETLAAIDPAVDALMALKPIAALQIQGTTETADRVFIVPQSTLVLQFAAANRAAVEATLAPLLQALVFGGSSTWLRTPAATSFGSIEPLAVTAGGPGVFIISRGPSLADSVGANRPAATPLPLTYAAGYNQSLAFAPYRRLFGTIDPKDEMQPPFFGRNVGSLAASLPRLESIRIRSLEAQSTLSEEVVYQLK
jgi:hypothetical protein